MAEYVQHSSVANVYSWHSTHLCLYVSYLNFVVSWFCLCLYKAGQILFRSLSWTEKQSEGITDKLQARDINSNCVASLNSVSYTICFSSDFKNHVVRQMDLCAILHNMFKNWCCEILELMMSQSLLSVKANNSCIPPQERPGNQSLLEITTYGDWVFLGGLLFCSLCAWKWLHHPYFPLLPITLLSTMWTDDCTIQACLKTSMGVVQHRQRVGTLIFL